MSTPSATTVGTRSAGTPGAPEPPLLATPSGISVFAGFSVFSAMSATAVGLLSLPEVDEAADAGEQSPAHGGQPHVGGQLARVEGVDQREPHQVDVHGGRVGLE